MKAGPDTVVLGTIGYASPEQYGISQSDSKADIYAVSKNSKICTFTQFNERFQAVNERLECGDL